MVNAALKQQSGANTKGYELSMCWESYKNYVRKTVLAETNDNVRDITYWRNELFCNMLTYLLPITILALVPGVYMSFANGIPFLGIFDMLVFTVLSIITLKARLDLKYRKNLLIINLYGLSIILLYYLGDMGPGLLYLQALTVTTAVLLSPKAAYYSVAFNAIICLLFGLFMSLGFNLILSETYTVDSWIAVCSNLVTLSLVTAISLNLLCKGLETNIKDKKTAEDGFKMAYDRLLFHIENSPLGFIEWDQDGFVISKSKRAEQIFGWTLEETLAIRKSARNHIYEDDLSFTVADLKKLKSGEVDNIRVQNRSYTKDGRVIWCDWFNSALKDDDGNVIAIMSLVQDITSAKQAEEVLKQSELRFREFFESAPEGLAVIDINTLKIVRSNENAQKIFKFSADEMLTKGPVELGAACQPDGRSSEEVAWEFITGTMEGDKSVVEWLGKDANGKEIICELRLVALSANPEPQILASFVDITERKTSEEKLSKSEANLSAIIENTDAVIFSLDTNYRYITFNNVLKNTLKQVYNIDIKPGDNVFDFLYKDKPEEALEWKRVYTEALSGRSLQFEKVFDIGDFHQVVAFSIHPIVERDKVIGLSCITRDITKQKKIEENLFEAKHLLSEAQKLAKMGNWSCDIKTNKVFWSDSMREMYGLSAETEANLELFITMVYPEDRERVATKIKEAKLTGVEFEDEYRIIRANGEVRVVYTITTFEFDADKKTRRIFGTMQDVTEMSQIREDLKNHLLELENKVAERTQELQASNKTLHKEVSERIHIGNILQEKNKDITDSIIYAKRLQNALLPGSRSIEKNFADAFIFNRPKAIVSGDFYWLHRHCKKIMLACADATGHGVPGAFMSLLGVDLLNSIVVDQQWKHPSLVLEMLDDSLINLLNREKEERVADGIDMVFCKIDTVEKTINFAGAMGSITLISKGKAVVYKGSRFALGGYMETSKKRFETLEIPYKEGDMLYLSSDGFKDQFGGTQNKKLGCKRMLSMLEQIHHLPGPEQNIQVTQVFEDWKGGNSQVDDVMLIGVRL